MKKLNSNSGMVLLMVIMLTIVLSVVAISIMSINVSQIRSNQSIVDSVIADQVALGAFYKYHQERAQNVDCQGCDVAGACTVCSWNVNMNGKTYTVNIAIDSSGVGINNTDQININVGYPKF